MKLIGFIIAELLLLFATLVLGGQPWVVLLVMTLVAQSFTDLRVKSLALVAPSLLWVALFRVTGNRELFFPYSMYLAAHVSLLFCSRTFWLGSLGGALVVTAFLAVRFLQDATLRVLAVEFGVAVAILPLALIAYAFSPNNSASRAVIVIVASLIAYACLSI
jgi:hypothetical protein